MKLDVYTSGKEENRLKARTKLIIVAIITAIVAVYGIELGTRVAMGSGKLEYLIAVIVILVLLAAFDIKFYTDYEKERKAP